MMDFTPRILPHSLKETVTDSGKWQLTFHHHRDGDIVLPTVGTLSDVYTAASEYLEKNYPGYRMA